jgi:hypothetical protein
MKQSVRGLALWAVLGAHATCLAADVMVAKEAVVDQRELKRLVEVGNATLMEGGDVTGTVVNRSVNPVRDVKLAIQYMWLWRSEMRPGTDDPGRTDFHTLSDVIPPGERVNFTYRPSAFLPRRADGNFEVHVTVVSLVQIEPAPARSGAAPAP